MPKIQHLNAGGYCDFNASSTERIRLLNVSVLAQMALGQFSGHTKLAPEYIYPVFGPTDSAELRDLHCRQYDFYDRAVDPILESLQGKGVPDDKLGDAVFWILRGFLSPGIVNSGWWEIFRGKNKENLEFLRYHPLEEVRTIAEGIEGYCHGKRCPGFSGHSPELRNPRAEDYRKKYMEQSCYVRWSEVRNFGQLEVGGMDLVFLQAHADLMRSRPKWVKLPDVFSFAGTMLWEGCLDFASLCNLGTKHARMPLLTLEGGFQPWYLDQLPAELRKEAEELLDHTAQTIERAKAEGVPETDLQYYVPMGHMVPLILKADLPSLVRLTEFWSSNQESSILRANFSNVASKLLQEFGGMGLRLDLE